jgi:heptosyltransferase-3
VLTLPTIRALRIAFPQSYIEVLGYTHIVRLGLNPLHANAARSIESATVAPFFARNAALPADLSDHFAGFDLIISYLFDPDGIFAANLARAGAPRVVHGPAILSTSEHAVVQLSEPLRELEIPVTDFAPNIPVARANTDRVALHPGSGSSRKNWPVHCWMQLAEQFGDTRLLIVGGEADREQIDALRNGLGPGRVGFAENLPLPQLAETLGTCDLFLGQDSGISHIAAAAGTRCVLLFGPTDPRIWAPLNTNVHVVRAPNDDLTQLEVSEVVQELMRIGIST